MTRDRHIASLQKTLANVTRLAREGCIHCIERDDRLRDTLTVLMVERDLAEMERAA